jgi:superfamily II DNA or RNA helicase
VSPAASILEYDQGTLVFRPIAEGPVPPAFVRDERRDVWRALGHVYRDTVLWLREHEVPHEDRARAWKPLGGLTHLAPRDPRPYQREALDAWTGSGRRGLVVLPTGSGKSYLAEMCLLEADRPTLIVVPTLDLLAQWHHRLTTALGLPIGLLGGGSHEILDITVSTYASAWLHVEALAHRFGLVIFDEVHHLPSESHLLIAESLLAPFRLGLTATPERADGRDDVLDELVGPLLYRKDIQDLSGDALAPYETVQLRVRLSPEEQAAYDRARASYRDFCRTKGLQIRSPADWALFIQAASRSTAGRIALRSWREARRLSFRTERKLELLEDILLEESGRRTIIFTDDNATAYRISLDFLVPCITHQTPVRERSHILAAFASGAYEVVVTSRVLNEGVDIPDAEVGVVVSGTGSVREHVQRLGRLLRPRGDKMALLYELVTAGTSEEYTSERRREHEAYR